MKSNKSSKKNIKAQLFLHSKKSPERAFFLASLFSLSKICYDMSERVWGIDMLKKAAGTGIQGIGKVVKGFFEAMIAIFATIVILAETLRQGVLQLLLAGGCLLLFILLNPIGFLFLMQPEILVVLFIAFIVPLLGRTFLSFLRYWEYAATEYLFDYAAYLKTGKNRTFRSFGAYGEKYERIQWEKMQREQERRRQEQQRMWEERFRQWVGQQQYQGGYYQRPPGGGYTQNPYDDFRQKYEKAARTLGVSTQTDEYQVKLAYRKLAKQYHPDINKSPDATVKFQEINDAYDFLSKENIERYKQMTKGA